MRHVAPAVHKMLCPREVLRLKSDTLALSKGVARGYYMGREGEDLADWYEATTDYLDCAIRTLGKISPVIFKTF